MRLNKALLVFFALTVVGCPLSAALNFEQEVTLASFKSKEDSRDIATQFLCVAKGDLDLKVFNVKYKQKKWGENLIEYNAIIKCHVSKPDIDVAPIQ